MHKFHIYMTKVHFWFITCGCIAFLCKCFHNSTLLSQIIIISFYSPWADLRVIDGPNVCAIICPAVYILQSIPSFGCFCFLLLYISMDFLFNLGQHCEGRQGIDFCPRGLTGTRISLSSWGFTAGCDNTQNTLLNLSANLLPNQANLKITWCLPP